LTAKLEQGISVRVKLAPILLLAFPLLTARPARAQDGAALASEGSTPPPPIAKRAWLGAQERNVWGMAGAKATSEYGADLLAGAWLFNEHVQPILDVGLARVFNLRPGESVETLRFGGRIAVGSAFDRERLWLGVAVGLVAQAGWLNTWGPSPAWAASPSFSGLLQGRVAKRFLIGAEAGAEHSIPPLRWGNYSVFNAFRLQMGLQVGVILGEPISAS
jgi:hypothetical protein